MDNFFYLIINLNYYFPWYNFLSDFFMIQLIFLYLLITFYNSKNIYYTLLYFFFLIFLLGITLSILQAELFTGFLWTIELTVILISLILFFYLNVEGGNNLYSLKINNFLLIFIIFLFISFYFILNLNYINLNYYNEINWLYFNYYFDDWYESLNNFLMNDFLILTLSYYFINNIEFLIIGYLLFITSIICVLMNRSSKNSKISGNSIFLNLFNFFSKYLNYSFLRKQNLLNQSIYDPNIRIFKKKKW